MSEAKSKAYAEEQVQRKIQGKRVNFNEDVLRKRGIDPKVAKREYSRLIGRAGTRRQIQRAAEEKIRERELGLKPGERRQLRGFAEKKGETLEARQGITERTVIVDGKRIEMDPKIQPAFAERQIAEGKKEVVTYGDRMVYTREKPLGVAKSKDDKLVTVKETQFTYTLPFFKGTQGLSFKGKTVDVTQAQRERLGEIFGTISSEMSYAQTAPVGLTIPGTPATEIISSRGTPVGDVLAGASKGYTKEWFVRPERQLALVAVGAVVPPVLAKTGTFLAAQQVATPAVTVADLGTTVGIGAVAAYTKIKGTEIALQPTWYSKGEVIGKTGAELTALGLGSRIYRISQGYFRTQGRTYIKTEKLVPKDVLTGQHRFPQAATSKHYKLFMTKSQRLPGAKDPVMYHATGQQFWKTGKGYFFKTEAGTSELPGLYGSYGVSPHFLRVGSPEKMFGSFNVFAQATEPGIAVIRPGGFVKGGKTTTSGYAFIPGIKTEVEAIIPPGSFVVGTKGQYFTTWKGIRIPIDEFVTLTGTPPAALGAGTTTGLAAGSGVPITSSAISSSSLAVSLAIPLPTSSYIAPSKSYSVVSYSGLPSPSAPSYPSSYAPSKSYVPPSPSSYAPPSYPPSYPPSRPPSRPPYYPPSYPPYYPPARPPKQPPVLLPGIQERRTRRQYPVFLRRFGKFRLIGYGATQKQAIGIGKRAATLTLGATFKVPGARPIKIKGFRTKKEDGDIVFIEKKKRRLKKGTGEIPEIQYWKGVKGGIKI